MFVLFPPLVLLLVTCSTCLCLIWHKFAKAGNGVAFPILKIHIFCQNIKFIPPLIFTIERHPIDTPLLHTQKNAYEGDMRKLVYVKILCM